MPEVVFEPQEDRGRSSSTLSERLAVADTVAEAQAALDGGADIEYVTGGGATPLLRAAARGINPDVVRYLIERGANLEATTAANVTALHLFAAHGQCDLIQAAITAGCDPNAKDDDGATPLMEAVDAEQDDAAVLLIRLGADPCLEMVQGETALTFGSLKVFEAALDSGVSINKATGAGVTALMGSVMRDDVAKCARLIALGAELNATNNQGESALHMAVQWNAWKCLVLLLDAGADTKCTTKEGVTLLDALSGAESHIRVVYECWVARQAMRDAARAAPARP